MEDFDEHDFVSAHWRMIDGFEKVLVGKEISPLGNGVIWRMVFSLLLDCDIHCTNQLITFAIPAKELYHSAQRCLARGVACSARSTL